MIKKLIALFATALFSMNALAGYTQYNFHLSPGDAGLDGFIIQHDSDQSIALFGFQLNDPSKGDGYFGAYFTPADSEGCICLISEATKFRKNGPTDFSIEDYFGADHFTTLSVSFARAKGGAFRYTANYTADLFENQPAVYFAGEVSGLATRGAIDPFVANYLDEIGGYEQGVPHIIPTYIGPSQVPEPTSIALFALGAAGLAGIRRRKTAR